MAIIISSIAGLIFLTDFFLKSYLSKHLTYCSIPVIKNIFHITITFNTGAAFGILKDRTDLLIYLSLIFIVFFLFSFRQELRTNRLLAVAAGLVIGGAISNLCDRIFLGYVVDYLDFRIWPVFNLSDSSVTIGALIIFWYTLTKKKV